MIRGNHDNRMSLKKLAENNKIAWVKDYYMLKLQDDEIGVKQNIVLCHYPFERWDKAHYGAWHLHGHCHGTLLSTDNQARLDVGVDAHEFQPISYGEIKLRMTRKVFKPIKGRKSERA